MIPETRPIRPDEVAVVRAALANAPSKPFSRAAVLAVQDLTVVARCECGCASVDFVLDTVGAESKRLADGVGTTPRGGKVGVLVWGHRDAVTGLEIYDLGAGGEDLALPVPGSIGPWLG